MKKLLLSAVILTVSASASFADALMFTVNATPYDKQMARIRPILENTGSQSSNGVSMNTVNEWMTDLREIPYGYALFWKTPSETLSGAPADCKAKSVALYERMKAAGATNVRLVIGKRTPMSKMTHAWLAWETEGGSYVLDPTFNYSATKAEKVGKRNYQPLYAYAGAKKFRAGSALVAQN
ncbi:MAG TPA: hypothetical protein VK993_13265 [Chthoniobacterales bacterium]|nr:hypothetical protein [Chthoniobacterales bacterium]